MSTINIKFPFNDSVKGFFLDMTEDDNAAIKSNLMHLLMTAKGERYYLPQFGTDLRKHIFEPNDSITQSEIKQSINEDIKTYLPNLTVTDVKVKKKDNSDYATEITIQYIINEGAFEKNDYLIINY